MRGTELRRAKELSCHVFLGGKGGRGEGGKEGDDGEKGGLEGASCEKRWIHHNSEKRILILINQSSKQARIVWGPAG